ncbi:MAG TPA: zf-HC2 domain-containing protein [Thermoanaerobaculia bacterium]|jgi:hypothetical protein|nr:zf-HC2 domain-containing protein [Thermoanaerobaculia bacterium]
MTCDDAIELLPWLLNDTLEAGERREVSGHLGSCERCRHALAETRTAWEIINQHLPTEALVAMAYGESPAGIDPATAERHLDSCPQCAAELELARTSRRLEEDDRIAIFPGPRIRHADTGGSRSWRAAAMAAGLAGVVAATGWVYEARQAGSLAQRLAQRPAAVRESRAGGPVPTGEGSSRQQVAELEGRLRESETSLAQVGKQLDQASSQIAELQEQTHRLAEPQLNTWSDLVSGGDVVRGGAAEEVVVIPANRAATPMLEASLGGGVREIEILTGANQVLWKASGLRPTQEGDYRITVPPGFLKPGRYTIQLYSSETGKRIPRESYKIRVE